MIRMKALRPCNMGPGATKVRLGREFMVESEGRARELEGAGLAYRVEPKVDQPPIMNMQPPPENEAAHSGPFDLAGGPIGEEPPVPSLLPDHQPRRRRSKRSEDESAS